jgi:hypothetical protein
MSDAQFRADIDSIILSYAPNYGVGNVSIASTTEQKEGFLSIVKVIAGDFWRRTCYVVVDAPVACTGSGAYSTFWA